MQDHKLTHKAGEAGERLLWWIEKANEYYRLAHPPCYLRWWEWRTLRGRAWARLIHVLYCHSYPPHRPGESPDEAAIRGFSQPELKAEFAKLFPPTK